MAKRRLTAEEATARLVAGAQAAVGRYVEGIRNTDVNPMERAAQKANKAAAGYADSIASGRWQRGLMSATKEEWIAGATAGGGSAYTSGIQAKTAKIARKLGPALDATYNVADRVASVFLSGLLSQWRTSSSGMKLPVVGRLAVCGNGVPIVRAARKASGSGRS